MVKGEQVREMRAEVRRKIRGLRELRVRERESSFGKDFSSLYTSSGGSIKIPF